MGVYLNGSLQVPVLVVEVGMAPADVSNSHTAIQLDALVEVEDGSIIVLCIIEGVSLPIHIQGLEGDLVASGGVASHGGM